MKKITPQQANGQDDSHITWLSDTIGLHCDVIASFNEMKDHAQADGIDLTIASGFRNFDRQLSIWNRKFSGELAIKSLNNEIVDIRALSDSEIVTSIMLFSALPGTSRHHWGTDFDLYAPNLLPSDTQLQLEPWEYLEHGPFWPLTQWLNQHALRYGFSRVYKEYTGGVAQEPWHFSHIETAKQFERFSCKQFIEPTISNANILGKDAILATLDEIINRFILLK